MDNNDEIVEEIPVYVTKTLKDNLFVFQYPTHPFATKGRDLRHSIEDCYVKPINQQVKFQLSLNTDPKFYNREKGEQLATPNNTSKNDCFSRRNIMEKQHFISSPSSCDASRMMVAVYADKELHLTPLKAILQMRPSFEHIEIEEKRKKAQEKRENGSYDDDDDDDDDDGAELQQVKVKFARSGPLTKKASDRERYDNFIKDGVGEPWCEGMWYTSDTEEAKLEREKLIGDIRQVTRCLHLRPKMYTKRLVPSAEEWMHIDTIVPPKVISRARLLPLPLPDQLRVLLKDARMLYFDEIIKILRESVDPEICVDKVLSLLPQVGILMQGIWIPQSDVVYPKDTFSYPNGVRADLMQRGRDYVLYHLFRNHYVYRKYILSGTQLPTDEAMQVLESVAHRNKDRKWELLLPPDKQFEKRHPDLVQRQEMLWRATEQIYIDMDAERKRTHKKSQRDSKSFSESADSTTTTAAAAIPCNQMV